MRSVSLLRLPWSQSRAGFRRCDQFAQRRPDSHCQLVKDQRRGDAVPLLKGDDAGSPNTGLCRKSILAQTSALSGFAKDVREFGHKAFCGVGGQSPGNYDLTRRSDMSVLGHIASAQPLNR